MDHTVLTPCRDPSPFLRRKYDGIKKYIGHTRWLVSRCLMLARADFE
jgi:hypothetical protein